MTRMVDSFSPVTRSGIHPSTTLTLTSRVPNTIEVFQYASNTRRILLLSILFIDLLRYR